MRVLQGAAAQRRLAALERRREQVPAATQAAARRIVSQVRREGDRALRRFAQRWDGLRPQQPLRVPGEEMAAAWRATPPALRAALRRAARHIRRYAQWQRPREWSRQLRPGLRVGQVVRPLESVGCYVPGGRYPLPSTLLMTAIPAQVAGVRFIRVVSPHPAQPVLAAAAMLGVDEVYRAGGAQAIAALAYGTASIPAVQKILGPGNAYVTAAKRLVAADCAIDFEAGPTEVVLVGFEGEPACIAADLVAQAEHDPQALAVFLTDSPQLAAAVCDEVHRCSQANRVARAALARRGCILVLDSRPAVMEAANRIAPEHLTIPAHLLPMVRNAGSVFLGEHSPQAAGDYASGPNHVLPTAGMARLRGGLSVLDFVKVISVQELTPAALEELAPTIITLAEAEGLGAHAESIRVRSAHA